ncbi:MAG: hypothetical protein LUH08_05930 [Ruminococcus sp.]|nr:hypothetical protein [Ruminococcus sp.]
MTNKKNLMKRLAVLACVATMSLTSISLTTEALGDQTITTAVSTAVSRASSSISSFVSKQVTVKSDFTCASDAVRINWNKVSGATGYRIYRYNATTKKWVKLTTIKNGNTTTYRNSGLAAGTTYKYKVKAYKKVNGTNYWGKASATKTVTTKPKQITVKSSYTRTSSAIRINWSKVTGATGYRVYRYNSSTKKWVTIATIKSSNTTTYRDSGLSAGTTYKYKVKAYKKLNGTNYWGKASATKSATTKKVANSVSVSVSNKKVYGTSLKKYASVPSGYATSSTITVTGNNIVGCDVFLLEECTCSRSGDFSGVCKCGINEGISLGSVKKASQNKYTCNIKFSPEGDTGVKCFEPTFYVDIVYADGTCTTKYITGMKFYDCAKTKAFGILDDWYKNNIKSSMTDEEKLLAIGEYIAVFIKQTTQAAMLIVG